MRSVCDDRSVRLRINTIIDRLRASFLALPMLALILALVLGSVTLSIDERLESTASLPFAFTSTVGSARAVLSTTAGATISIAGIAFSVVLLVIQLSSSQYSPRITHTLFRDRFNKNIMALVIGTFTYCVLILRSVRSPLDDDTDALIPNLSVSIASLLGILSVLGVIAFINHNAHAMDVSKLLQRVTDESIERLEKLWADPDGSSTDSGDARVAPTGPLDPAGGPDVGDPPVAMDSCVRMTGSGWVQQIDVAALVECAPEVRDMVLHIAPGRYVIEGARLLSLPSAPDEPDELAKQVNAAILTGDSRTSQQDVSYGIRKLVDVAVRSLSSGGADPTTAQDAIFHIAAILSEALRRDPPPHRHERSSGGRLTLVEQIDHDELVTIGFEEIRRAAAAHPTVCVYLLEALHLLADVASTRQPAPAIETIHRQADLVVTGCASSPVIDEDIELVRSAHRSRFGGRDAGTDSTDSGYADR